MTTRENIMAVLNYEKCPDHRIMPDAIFENVQYYCDKLHNIRF